MADFARFLPLSQRPRVDESSVTSDRRAQVAEVVDQVAAVAARTDAPGTRIARFIDEAGLRPSDPAPAPTPAGLHAFAAELRDGGRQPIRSLARTVRAALAFGRESDTTVELSELVSGSVALYAATSAPHDRRAVIAHHTLRASDAEWAFGHGPVLTAPAVAILEFLLGLSDDPPKPAPAAS
ncbi:hypothetical protein ARHIZOSPH14_16720 [Agromyces rhizosphaerae]|uniref:Uncharacterized protein n=1 Tax=Agromyces rhizosphaerae TaxID=88374 RepID=A0A9W6CW50_9MICO|nr:hypothetical protein [Agromyces rhizosphaerae]GLI27430.1 hypothetical protein ARHIZOSPH14_16720 [Agromyces rhizosphaerae]